MIKRRFFSYAGLLLVLCACFLGQAVAHEFQPGSLEMRQLTTESYEVIWRAPIYYGKPHPARLQLPGHWQVVGKSTIKQLADFTLHRHMVSVSNGIFLRHNCINHKQESI